MNLEQLMERVGDLGATIIIKMDGERGVEDAGRWTFVVSGGPLADRGPIRVDAPSLGECLTQGLALLRIRGEEWQWFDNVDLEM